MPPQDQTPQQPQQPVDPTRAILDPLTVDKGVKHAAWDAYHSAQTPEQFRAYFDKAQLPQEAKRALWSAKFGQQPSVAQPGPQNRPQLPGDIRQWMGRAANPSPQQPSGEERFVSGFTGAATGLPGKLGEWPEAARQMVADPGGIPGKLITDIDTPLGYMIGQGPALKYASRGLYNLVHGLVEGSSQASQLGMERMEQPGAGIAQRASGALEYIEGGVPFFGPSLVKAGRQFEQNDIAGGVGTTLGAAGALVAPELRTEHFANPNAELAKAYRAQPITPETLAAQRDQTLAREQLEAERANRAQGQPPQPPTATPQRGPREVYVRQEPPMVHNGGDSPIPTPPMASEEQAAVEARAGRQMTPEEAHAERIGQVIQDTVAATPPGVADEVQAIREQHRATLEQPRPEPPAPPVVREVPQTPAPTPPAEFSPYLPDRVDSLRDQINEFDQKGKDPTITPEARAGYARMRENARLELKKVYNAHLRTLDQGQLGEHATYLERESENAGARAQAIENQLKVNEANAQLRKTLSEDVLRKSGRRVVGKNELGEPVYSDVGPSNAERQAYNDALGRRTKEVADTGATDTEAEQYITDAKNELAALKQSFQDKVEDAMGALASRRGETESRPTDRTEAMRTVINELGQEFSGRLRELQDIIGRGDKRRIYAGEGKPIVDPKTGAVTLPGAAPVITGDAMRAMLDTRKHVAIDLDKLRAKAEELRTDADQYGKLAQVARKYMGQRGFAGDTAPRYEPKGPFNLDPRRLESMARNDRDIVKPGQPTGDKAWLFKNGYALKVPGFSAHENVILDKLVGVSAQEERFGDSSRAYAQALREGAIVKHGPGQYELDRMNPRAQQLMEADYLRDLARWHDLDLRIDANRYEPKPARVSYYATHSELADDYDYSIANLVGNMDRREGLIPRSEQGVSGVRLMGGMAVGGIVGGAVGGPLGAAGGLVLGSLAATMGDLEPVRAIGRELADIASRTKGAVGDNFKALWHAVSPTSGMDPKILDDVYGYKGGIDLANYRAAASLKTIKMAFDQMPEPARDAFVNAVMRGEPQASPELDSVAKLIRERDDADGHLLQAFRENMPWVENHFRLQYKEFEPNKLSNFARARRPIEGGKGMFKPRTFQDLSEARTAGFTPITTNPIDMWLLAHNDVMRYAHSQLLWDRWKENGTAKFVPLGENAPLNYAKLNDKIAKVWFPAASGEGMVTKGEYWVEQGAARILNNYLSDDWIRSNSIGRAALNLKNASVAFQLLGAFHAFKETGMAVGSAIGLGYRQLSMGELGKGATSIGGSLAAPYHTYMTGVDFRAMLADPDEFFSGPRGPAFDKAFPNAREFAYYAQHSGMRFDVPPEYKSNLFTQMIQNYREGKYISGTVKAPLGLIYAAMSPLTEHAIPNLKWGAFLQDMSQALSERQEDIANGSITTATLARQVGARIENGFGQLNTDNFFWQKTMRTLAQLYYTSASWRFGDFRLTRDAITGQLREFNSARRYGRAPRMDPNLATILGEATIWGVAGAIITKLYTGKNPQNPKDVLQPRIGGVDTHGMPLRVNLPAYASQAIPSLLHNPARYLAGGQASVLGRIGDMYQNRDFYGTEIRNPDDPKQKQFLDMLDYLVPPNINYQNIQELLQRGAPMREAALSAIGAYPSSATGDMSPAVIEARNRMARYYSAGPRTTAEAAHSQLISQLVALQRNNDPRYQRVLNQGFKDGTLKGKDISTINERASTSYLSQLIGQRDLTVADLEAIYAKASPAEKIEIAPVLHRKIRSTHSTAAPPS